MANNKQCVDCIHNVVCAYKEHYEDAVALYKEAKKECGKYPWFRCDITCIQYYKGVPNPRKISQESEGAND